MWYTCKQCGLEVSIKAVPRDLTLIIHLIICPFIDRSHTVNFSKNIYSANDIYSANEWQLEIWTNHSIVYLYKFKDGSYNLASARFIVIETGLANSLEKIYRMIETDHHIDCGTYTMNTRI